MKVLNVGDRVRYAIKTIRGDLVHRRVRPYRLSA